MLNSKATNEIKRISRIFVVKTYIGIETITDYKEDERPPKGRRRHKVSEFKKLKPRLWRDFDFDGYLRTIGVYLCLNAYDNRFHHSTSCHRIQAC